MRDDITQYEQHTSPKTTIFMQNGLPQVDMWLE